MEGRNKNRLLEILEHLDDHWSVCYDCDGTGIDPCIPHEGCYGCGGSGEKINMLTSITAIITQEELQSIIKELKK